MKSVTVRADRPARARAIFAAVALPFAATAVSLIAGSEGRIVSSSLLLLAVVLAARLGGSAAGLVAAVLSFLCLNYFFTPPKHTFTVSKTEDLVALFVFLAVAAVVGALFARALSERARSERSAHETRLLNSFSNRLLSDEPLDHVADAFAQTASDLFGLARCDVVADGAGQPLRASVVQRHLDDRGARIEIAISAGGTPFGTVVAARAAGAPEFGDDERRLLDAFVAQLGLALERARLDAVARGARMEAEVSAMRASLFSSVTHDLRTPLSSIKAGVTSLLDREAPPDDAQREELLRTMLEETDRLNRLVGNILNLARARAGALVLERQLVPFEDVVEAVLVRLRAALAPFRVRTVFRPDVPAIWIDAVQLDQALTNVIENAIRHSPPSGEIGVSVAAFGSGIEVRVTDQGPGVPPDERERVFDAFYRGGDRSRGGAGLGLAIARAIVGAHAGRIWIEGAPGGGAAIVLQLPVGEQP